MIRTPPRPKRPSPRTAAKRERMRAHIFEAAAREFARRGFHATSMQDIARASGFSAPSLYTYFEGKQEILEVLRAAMIEKFAACYAEPLPDSLSFEQKFFVLLHRLVGFLEEHREAASFLFFAGQGEPGGGKSSFDQVSEQFERWLRRHARRRDLGRCPPQVAAKYVTGIVFGGFHRWAASAGESPLRAASEIYGIFFRGVPRGLP